VTGAGPLRNPQNSGVRPILVLNSGSSSLKFGVFAAGPDEELLFEGTAERIRQQDGSLEIRSADGSVLLAQAHTLESQEDALQKLAGALAGHLRGGPIAVGHRVVHGGPKLREHQLVTPEMLQQLKDAVHFAPLHIPLSVALIEQAQKIFPSCPHFACFDNAFHRSMPEVARRLPLPARYFDTGVMRYGFHGLSYESIIHRLGDNLPERAIFAHLGSGSSLAAIHHGKSIDTSMGLTPTGGVPMGTRTGDLDPGVLLYLMRTEPTNADALETLLNHQCGLTALSNGESDMQKLLESARAGEASAELAIAIFVTAIRKCIGAYCALLGGVDMLVFTGGIGQHSQEIRDRVCAGLDFLNLGPLSKKVLALPTDEERQIARHCRTLLG